jgi:hypothetical protein
MVTNALCLCCGWQGEVDEHAVACPGCGCNEHMPADAEETVTVTLTAHELRIMTMWSMEWGAKFATPGHVPMDTIVDRLVAQTGLALTLEQEMADVARFAGARKIDFQKTMPGGETRSGLCCYLGAQAWPEPCPRHGLVEEGGVLADLAVKIEEEDDGGHRGVA